MFGRKRGPFEIIEVLGEGSYGTVCVARVTSDRLRRRVALKILKRAYARNETILNRTRDEARLLSRINHPNIVRVEQLMEMRGRPVLVMEHVEGVSLGRLLRAFPQGLPISVALSTMLKTCLALKVAHEDARDESGAPLGVIHRDIKPSNIILSRYGEVKVVDFGIAKGSFDGREAETESLVLGSRPYMAPERLDGVEDTGAVDVYSAGICLFELVSGRPMSLSINPENHGRALEKSVSQINPAELTEWGRVAIRNLIREMCAYKREERPSVGFCVARIDEILNSISPSLRQELVPFARREVAPLYRMRTLERQYEGAPDELRQVSELVEGPNRAFKGQQNPLYSAGVLAVGGLTALALLSAVSSSQVVAPLYWSMMGYVGKEIPVFVWIPSDAKAQADRQTIDAPGYLSLSGNMGAIKINFEDGRRIQCPLTVKPGMAVRYVRDGGMDSVSINDGPAQRCFSQETVGLSTTGEKGGQVTGHGR